MERYERKHKADPQNFAAELTMLSMREHIKDLQDQTGAEMDGRNRSNIVPGVEVYVVLKEDQRTGKQTKGIVKDILTRSAYHPWGIKVRLEDRQIGRVQKIC